MPLLVLRFDLRNPAFSGVSYADRVAAALDIAAWADTHAVALVLSEHHGSDDGYLPSAVTMAAAVAARTERIAIIVSAVVAPFHDPIRLAEEVRVVDAVSRGRLTVVLANGYVPSEFEMFGVPIGERVRRTTEAVETLRAARTGEPFEFRGRTVRVTPGPDEGATPGPSVLMGGSGPAAAKRAARIADGFQPSNVDAWEVYRAERISMGEADPGGYLAEPTGFLHVATDPDKAWRAIAPHALHESAAYGRWAVEGGMEDATGYAEITDADELRATGRYRVVTPAELVAEIDADPWAPIILSPMMGGLPPELAWESLRLIEHEVLPRCAS